MKNKRSYHKVLTLLAMTLALSQCSLAQQPEFQWARNMGGSWSEWVNSIAVDAIGNVYSTGAFPGTATDFDPGPGTYNLTAAGQMDIFISKLDASGNFIWAKQLSGTLNEVGNSIAVDATGNVYTTGGFQGTVDFDPGPGIYNLTSGSSSSDIFISKLDTAGNFVWAKQIGGPSGPNLGTSITLDTSGSIYFTGYFVGTTDFDPGPGTYNLSSPGSFISKLDADGNFVWAKQFTGQSTNDSFITLDAGGNIYTTGTFSGTIDFDPGVGTYNLTSSGKDEIFISKLDADGNFVWAKSIGGYAHDYSRSIAVDVAGNVYTTGRFGGTADFDPGAGTYNLSSSGSYDIFVSKLDAAGNFVWAKQMGGATTYEDAGNSIALDVAGDVYVTGGFSGTADFDPGPGTYNLTVISGDKPDIFICKLDASGNFVWAKQIGTYNRVDYGNAIVLDASGNIYTGGSFQVTADFDPGPGTYNLTRAGNSSSSSDIFILKMGQCISSNNLVVSASKDTTCAGTPGVLNVTGASGSIQWQSSTGGANFADIPGATNSSFISTDSSTTYFRVYTVGSCGTDTSSALQLVVKPAPVAAFISHSSGQQVTFTNQSNGATIYNWDFGDNTTASEENPVHSYSAPGIYHVCLTVFNGSNCSFTVCRDLQVELTGIEAIPVENRFTFYPNPFRNSIMIEQRQKNIPLEKFEIYDLLGKKVYEQLCPYHCQDKHKVAIDLSCLAKGMYFVKVNTTEKLYIQRIIKE